MIESQFFLYEERDNVGFLTLNRPPLNILNLGAIREFSRVLDEIAGRTGIDLVVFAGAGEKAFSAGVEVQEHLPDQIGEVLLAFHQVFYKLQALPQITIAMVRGYCLGGGCELVTFCDLAVAEEEAVFGQPEINVGCFPPVGAALLPEMVGTKRAAELIYTGRHISAFEAREMGLVNRLAPRVRLEETLTQLLEELQKKSPVVLRLTKHALRGEEAETFRKRLTRIEAIYLQELIRTHDCREGVLAFVEKRRPHWSGT